MSRSASASASGQLLGVLAAGARHRRPAAAAAADERRGAADHVRGADRSATPASKFATSCTLPSSSQPSTTAAGA